MLVRTPISGTLGEMRKAHHDMRDDFGVIGVVFRGSSDFELKKGMRWCFSESISEWVYYRCIRGILVGILVFLLEAIYNMDIRGWQFCTPFIAVSRILASRGNDSATSNG